MTCTVVSTCPGVLTRPAFKRISPNVIYTGIGWTVQCDLCSSACEGKLSAAVELGTPKMLAPVLKVHTARQSLVYGI